MGSSGKHTPATPATPAHPSPPPLAQPDGLQPLPVFVPDPLDALQLSVHHQWPPLRVAEDGSVLGGGAVAGQPLVAPRGHVGGVGEEAEGVQLWRGGNGHLKERGHWGPSLEQREPLSAGATPGDSEPHTFSPCR